MVLVQYVQETVKKTLKPIDSEHKGTWLHLLVQMFPQSGFCTKSPKSRYGSAVRDCKGVVSSQHNDGSG